MLASSPVFRTAIFGFSVSCKALRLVILLRSFNLPFLFKLVDSVNRRINTVNSNQKGNIMKTTLLIYTLVGVLKLAVPFQIAEACDRAAAHMAKQQTAHIFVCEVVK